MQTLGLSSGAELESPSEPSLLSAVCAHLSSTRTLIKQPSTAFSDNSARLCWGMNILLLFLIQKHQVCPSGLRSFLPKLLTFA